jgi:hypothetical protein
MNEIDEFIVVGEIDLEDDTTPLGSDSVSIKARLMEFLLLYPLMTIYFVISLPILILINFIEIVKSVYLRKRIKLVYFLEGAPGMVGTEGSLKMVIYPNDHPPPHFHVLYDGYNSKFKISSGECIGGTLPERYQKKVNNWRKSNVHLLRAKWNAFRPKDV